MFGLREEAKQQENPYLDFNMLKEEEKEVLVAGRLNTPNNFNIDQPPLNPIASATFGEDPISKRKSRRSEKFLIKPGTAHSNKSGATKLGGFGESRKETPEVNRGSLHKSYTSLARDDENIHGYAEIAKSEVSNQHKTQEAQLKRATTLYSGENYYKEGPERNLTAFLRDTTESVVKLPTKQKFDEGTSKGTFRPEDRKLSVIRSEPDIDVEKYENIEVTGNMSRHQIAELNDKLKEMTETIKLLKEENQRLSAIGRDFEGEKTKATSSLREELTKTKEELSKLQKTYGEEIAKAREEGNKRVEETQTKYKNVIEILEEEKKQQQELHKKELEREREKSEQLHKLELNELGKINTKQLESQRLGLEAEIEMLKKQLQKKEDLNKITLQVDSIANELKNRMEAEVKTKSMAVSDKEQELEDRKRKLDGELEIVKLKKRDLEERTQKLEVREEQVKREEEEKRNQFQYNKDMLERNHKEALKKLEARQNKYLEDHKNLELERAQFERDKNEWELLYKDQSGALELDCNAFKREKQDFIQFINESNR